jgi:glycosyltransferase involved in cell wall biosynthesis
VITISLCFIVKNEEHHLEQCLASVHGIADEIIIVDTGSTDQTKAIASKWTPHVYDYAWNDDFSAARNASFQYATQDYILWLDADDILAPEERAKLMKLKQTLPKEVDGLSMKYAIPKDEALGIVSHAMRLRLVKRGAGFKWRGFVHEDLVHDGPVNLMSTDITVMHTKKGKVPGEAPSRRNLTIYEKQLARGYAFNASEMFHYAGECLIHKQYEQAIRYYELCMAEPEVPVEAKVGVMHKLAACYVFAGQPEKEMELTLKSFTMDAPFPAFSCRMGEYFLTMGQLDAAIYWYSTAYLNPVGERYAWSFVEIAFQTWLPHHQLAYCYDMLGDTQQANFHRQRAELYRKGLSPANTDAVV